LQAVNQYFAAWNTTDVTKRTALLSEYFAATGTYVESHTGTKNGAAEMQVLFETFCNLRTDSKQQAILIPLIIRSKYPGA
jgi:hypothetical protein